MISDLLKLLKFIIGILPFILLCLLTKAVNLNKTNRGRQFLMPFIALVYCILAIVFLDKINDLLMKLINLLIGLLPILEKINWDYGLIYLSNTILVLVFIIVKGLILPMLSGTWGKNNKLTEATTGMIYEYDEDLDKWFLKKKWGQLKTYYNGIYYAALIVSSAIFVISQSFAGKACFKSQFYPVFGLLVLGEILFFLSGLTKTEFIEDILGEDEEAYRIANFGLLRKFFTICFRTEFYMRVLPMSRMELHLILNSWMKWKKANFIR